MINSSLQLLVSSLHQAGLKIGVTPDGDLVVTPSSLITDELRVTLRENKLQLIELLKTADPVALIAHRTADRNWQALAAVYHAHHFQCLQCIAAGRSASYGQRCESGLRLWEDYQTAASIS